MHADREGAEQVLPRKASLILIRTVLKGYLRHIIHKPSTEARDLIFEGMARVTCTNYLHHNFFSQKTTGPHRQATNPSGEPKKSCIWDRGHLQKHERAHRQSFWVVLIIHTSLSCKSALCYEAATDHARTLSLPIWVRGSGPGLTTGKQTPQFRHRNYWQDPANPCSRYI